MANETVFDLTQETALNAADRFPVQQTGASTRATSATLALMGGLAVANETVTGSNPTVAVGQMHCLTIAGLTASRTFELPTANVGERIGIYIVDGDDAEEIVIQGATGVSINGGTAAAEWSRLFIANECVTFLYRAANEWIVEHDGRIPCRFHAIRATDRSLTASTWTDVQFDSQQIDVGACYDPTTNYRFDARRDGFWDFDAQTRPASSLTDELWGLRLIHNTGSDADIDQHLNRGDGFPSVASRVSGLPVSAGDFVDVQAFTNATSESVDAAYSAGSINGNSYFRGLEVLIP